MDFTGEVEPTAATPSGYDGNLGSSRESVTEIRMNVTDFWRGEIIVFKSE